jgi:uncharacterized protein (DUF983 family)
MTEPKKPPVPNYYWAILSMKCPRCRTGSMFKDDNPYKQLGLKHIFDMPEHCEECGQKFDLEPGFWYGTGYVSYALAVAVSAASFVAWWVLIGISANDNRVLWWLLSNSILLVLLQPWLMRLSRVIYIRFFVRHDPDYKINSPTRFD